jgi:hypothetical protein
MKFYREIKALHAKLKLQEDGSDKQQTAEELVILNNQIQDNWKLIDTKQ